MNLKFSRQIFENTQIPNFMKIRPVAAELFNAEGQTDMTKLIVAFRNFASVYRSPYYIPRLWMCLSYYLKCLLNRMKERVLKNRKPFLGQIDF